MQADPQLLEALAGIERAAGHLKDAVLGLCVVVFFSAAFHSIFSSKSQ